jgi:hypothetical protein
MLILCLINLQGLDGSTLMDKFKTFHFYINYKLMIYALMYSECFLIRRYIYCLFIVIKLVIILLDTFSFFEEK